jgi:hypothetical protein
MHNRRSLEAESGEALVKLRSIPMKTSDQRCGLVTSNHRNHFAGQLAARCFWTVADLAREGIGRNVDCVDARRVCGSMNSGGKGLGGKDSGGKDSGG